MHGILCMSSGKDDHMRPWRGNYRTQCLQSSQIPKDILYIGGTKFMTSKKLSQTSMVQLTYSMASLTVWKCTKYWYSNDYELKYGILLHDYFTSCPLAERSMLQKSALAGSLFPQQLLKFCLGPPEYYFLTAKRGICQEFWLRPLPPLSGHFHPPYKNSLFSLNFR